MWKIRTGVTCLPYLNLKCIHRYLIISPFILPNFCSELQLYISPIPIWWKLNGKTYFIIMPHLDFWSWSGWLYRLYYRSIFQSLRSDIRHISSSLSGCTFVSKRWRFIERIWTVSTGRWWSCTRPSSPSPCEYWITSCIKSAAPPHIRFNFQFLSNDSIILLNSGDIDNFLSCLYC